MPKKKEQKEKKIERTTRTDYLFPDEVDIINEAKTLKEMRLQQKEVEEAERYIEGRTVKGQLKSAGKTLILGSEKVKARKFTPVPIRPAPLLTREQQMYGELFASDKNRIIMSGGRDNINELNRIDGILFSGNGIIDSGDDGETGRSFF